jgi:hypothetical protein
VLVEPHFDISKAWEALRHVDSLESRLCLARLFNELVNHVPRDGQKQADEMGQRISEAEPDTKPSAAEST